MRRNGKGYRYRDSIDLMADVSSDGETVNEWRTFMAGVPCLVVDVSGQSKYRGAQIEETLAVVVELHRVEGLRPDMRIIYGSRTLEIKAVKLWRAGNAREKHLAFCEEVVV